MPAGVFVPAQLNDLNVDVSLGTPARGSVMYRGATKWNALAAGTNGQVLTSAGAGADPSWATVSSTFAGLSDVSVPGVAQGAVLYRGAATFNALAAGNNGDLLTSGGAGANPSWMPPAAANLANAVILAPNSVNRNLIQPTADANKGLVLKWFSATQSANLLEMQDNTGAVVAGFDPAGRLGVGVPPNALQRCSITTTVATDKLLVLNGITGQTANLTEWQNAGSVQAYVDPVGRSQFLSLTLGAAAAPSGANALNLASGKVIAWDNGSAILATSGAQPLTFTNPYGSGGIRFPYGGNVGLFLDFNNSGKMSLGNTTTPLAAFHCQVGVISSGYRGIQIDAALAQSAPLLAFSATDSTTASQDIGFIDGVWATSIHASRTGRLVLSAVDFAGTRECLRIEASGSAPMIGFLGGNAVLQQANASQAAITAVADANAKAALQSLYNLLKNYNLAPATA